ncbi:MAG: sulfatase-like hydrolase/transferase, partial [Actinobacteria bacterium]|nr:sulfatase-like hydrolase/transferase [Actinomycetota bacterium]
GFDYWYGIGGTWDEAMWPNDKWFKDSGLKPSYVLESTGSGHLEELEVLDEEVRKNFDLTTLEKGKQWMEDSVAKDEPFFLYFNHSNVHFPTLARDEYIDSSDGGPLGDCIQMIDGDFQQLLDKVDELGIKDNTIVVFAADNGRDTFLHAPGNRGAQGNFRGGYFSTYEGNHRTVCIVRWPGHIAPGKADGMMHIVDWFPTLLNLIDHDELVPTDRVLDGVDQSAFIRGEQEDSNREHFPMFFDELYVGMRYRNFKILTYKIEDGSQPIQKLAMPHCQNLTVDPDEEMPYHYDKMHTWVLYQIYGPKSVEYHKSLEGDAVPKGAPLDFNPKKPDIETPILDALHHFFHGG